MIKKFMNIAFMCIVTILIAMPINVYAFDFEQDSNWKKFNEGCERTYTSPIKANEIIWGSITGKSGTKNNEMSVERNGVTLAEIKETAKRTAIKLEFHKYSDGSTAIICTGKHDITGHEIVMMIEPKNRYAYVYDTVSCVSEVVDLGEAVHIYKGRTLVPIRKFMETFGAKVIYQGKAGDFDIWWPSLHK